MSQCQGPAPRLLLPVFGEQFKMIPGMVAGRAYCRCFFAFMDIAAIAAEPFHRCFSLKYSIVFNIGQQGAIAFFVLLFGDGNRFKDGGNFIKALFPCRFGKRGIHVSPFVIFAAGGCSQVFRSRPDYPCWKIGLDLYLPSLKQFE